MRICVSFKVLTHLILYRNQTSTCSKTNTNEVFIYNLKKGFCVRDFKNGTKDLKISTVDNKQGRC